MSFLRTQKALGIHVNPQSLKQRDGVNKRNIEYPLDQPRIRRIQLIYGEELNVFISWSGPCAEKIALELKSLLNKLFNCINVYLSTEDIKPGEESRGSISKALEKSDYGILILTSTNLKEPWLMFEAGALSKNLDKATVIPIRFGREQKHIEGPIKNYQNIEYNKEKIFSLVHSLYTHLLGRNLLSGISEEALKTLFESNFYWGKFDENIKKIMKHYESHHHNREKNSKVKRQFEIDFSTEIMFGKDYGTIGHIPSKMIKFLNKYIGKEYLFIKPGDEEKDDKVKTETLMINDTRISTFLAITDGKRLLVFDRNAPQNTHLGRENNNYDVFGSVPFSLPSLEAKMKNEKFLQSKIERIEPISALALEDNTDERGLPLETVVMFGYAIFIREIDLRCAIVTENERCIKVFSLDEDIKNYTAKASIARKAIIEMEKRKKTNSK